MRFFAQDTESRVCMGLTAREKALAFTGGANFQATNGSLHTLRTIIPRKWMGKVVFISYPLTMELFKDSLYLACHGHGTHILPRNVTYPSVRSTLQHHPENGAVDKEKRMTSAAMRVLLADLATEESRAVKVKPTVRRPVVAIHRDPMFSFVFPARLER